MKPLFSCSSAQISQNLNMESFDSNKIEASTAPARILFLCTGNYYRSRFAEELFNFLSSKASLDCRATSLGFTPHPDFNPGPISRHALEALAARGISPRRPVRMPSAVQAHDFLNHEYVIALDETEHRPMMENLFPQFLSRVQFWQVQDLAWEPPERATARIERDVRSLLDKLSKNAAR